MALTEAQQDIINAIRQPSERSKQRKIGPSAIAGCPYHVGKALALYLPEQGSEVVDDDTNLASWMGTAVHYYLEHNLGLGQSESRWAVYDLKGYGLISGNVDLIYKNEIFDFKIVGQASYDAMRRAYRKEPDRIPKTIYRGQSHLYGYAVRQGGHDIKRVNLMVFPKHKMSFDDIRFFSEPYNEEFALKALDRLEKIWLAVQAGELEELPRDEDCFQCSSEIKIVKR